MLEAAARDGARVRKERGALAHRHGVMLARQGKLDEGLKALAQAARLNPRDLTIAFDRVVLLSWGRWHWEAVEAFQALPRPDEAPRYVRREAAEAYRAIFRFTEAMRLYVSLLDDPRDDADVLPALRSLLLEQRARFLDPAVNRLAQRGAVPPSWLATHAWTTAGIDKALADARQGLSSTARWSLAEALAATSPIRASLADWATLLHLGGRFEEAALLWPVVPAPRAGLRVAGLNALGRHQEALALAMTGCATHPTRAAACADAVRTLLRLEQRKEAAAIAGRLQGDGALALAAEIELHAGRYEAAHRLYAQVVAGGRSTPEARLGLALTHALLGESEEAKDALGRALETLSLEEHLLHLALTLPASLALAQTLNDLGRPCQALLVLEPLLRSGEPLTALREQARAFEAQGRRVEAVHVYEQMLALDPSDQSATRARVRLLGQLLALTPAREEADRLGDADVEHDLQALDEVIAWTRKGTELTTPGRDMRGRARRVLARVRSLREAKVPVSETLLRAGAEAALELDDDEQALALYAALYERLVDRDEGSSDEAVDVRLSQVRSLVRLLRFAEAQRMLDALDETVPLHQPGSNQPNWGKAAIATERGWMLIAQDRLTDARQHFLRLQAQAPGSAATLSGVAHTALLLGWKRQALEAFERGVALHPQDLGLRLGLSEALRINGQPQKAAAHAAELSQLVPADRDVRGLVRRLAFDRRPRVTLSAAADTQARDIGGLVAEASLEVPARFDLSIIGGYGWRREAAGPGSEASRHRASLGARFLWNRDLSLSAMGTADPFTGRWGLEAEAFYEPGDRSWLGLRAHTDVWSLPPGALRSGVSGRELFASGGFFADESLGLFGELGVLSMSDGTLLPVAMVEVHKRLLARGAWRTTVALDTGAATASQAQELYYAPTWAWVTAQASLDHTWTTTRAWRLEDRLSLRAGVDVVAGFGASERLGFFYEQTHTFGERGELVVDTGVTRQSFDGVPEVGWRLGLAGRLQF